MATDTRRRKKAKRYSPFTEDLTKGAEGSGNNGIVEGISVSECILKSGPTFQKRLKSSRNVLPVGWMGVTFELSSLFIRYALSRLCLADQSFTWMITIR
jgi:hypothetical protein